MKLEEARGTTEEKYLAASRALSGKAFEKRIQPFQDFAQLLDLRDAIMHLKPSDTRGPRRTAALAQRKLTYVTDLAAPLPWFDQLETPETALWAATVARNMMLAVLALTPEHEVWAADPLHILKRLIQDNARFTKGQ